MHNKVRNTLRNRKTTKRVGGNPSGILKTSKRGITTRVRPMMDSWFLREPERKLTFDNDLDSAYRCPSGKEKAEFGSSKYPRYIEYLRHYHKDGSLGCPAGKFPEYIFENGRYCCSDRMRTPQEMIEYVNYILWSFTQKGKVNEKVFLYLISVRNHVLNMGVEHDNIDAYAPFTIGYKDGREVVAETLEDWFHGRRELFPEEKDNSNRPRRERLRGDALTVHNAHKANIWYREVGMPDPSLKTTPYNKKNKKLSYRPYSV